MNGAANFAMSDNLADFVAAYQCLRKAAEQRILARRDLHLKAIHTFADALTIVDITDPAYWRVRLAGTKTCERVGHEMTGCNAQLGFPEGERSLRCQLAHRLFDGPYAIRAIVRETYESGETSLLDTVAVPLTGSGGERLVAHLAEVVRDIIHDFGDRPAADHSDIVSYRFVDLGYGLPMDSEARLSA